MGEWEGPDLILQPPDLSQWISKGFWSINKGNPAGIVLILVNLLRSHYRILFIKLPDLGLQLPKVSLQNQYVSLRILFIIHPDQPMEHL